MARNSSRRLQEREIRFGHYHLEAEHRKQHRPACLNHRADLCALVHRVGNAKFPYAGKTHDEWFHELNRVYQTYSPQWLDDAEFLFYIAYAGSSFCEGFIGLDEKDVAGMSEKAYNMYPENLIYQWGSVLQRIT